MLSPSPTLIPPATSPPATSPPDKLTSHEGPNAGPGAGAALDRAKSPEPVRTDDGLSKFINSRQPFRYGFPLLLGLAAAMFFVSPVTSDSFSPIRMHTNYLEEVCAAEADGSRPARIIFVGSSYIRTNIDPEALEAYLAVQGYPNVEVLLVGVLALNLQGANALVDRILEVEGLEDELSLLVVDQSYLPETRARTRARGSLPYQWLWGGHPLTQIPPTIRTILLSDETVFEKGRSLGELAYHVGKGAVYSTTGAALRVLSGETLHSEDPNNAFSLTEPIRTSKGFVPLEGKDADFEGEGEEAWRERVRRHARERTRDFKRETANDEIYRFAFNRILMDPRFDQAGVISMLSPSYFTKTDPAYVREMLSAIGSERCVLWDFGDPEGFPGLWDWESRHEMTHLNRSGAAAFAEEIGRGIVGFYERNPGIYHGGDAGSS